MAHVTDDRIMETTITTGTGALTLAGAVAGFRAFSGKMTSPSDTCFYMIEAVDANGIPTGDWETGVGTYSAASTLTRTTVTRSSNADTVVTLAAGTKRVGIVMISALGKSVDIQVFSTAGSFSWTRPLGAKWVDVQVFGGGGSGASGRKGAAATARGGGGGGAGGNYGKTLLPASITLASETVTVGVGATGGVSQATNSTNGLNGAGGGASSFGSWLNVQGGNAALQGTTTGGNGGSVSGIYQFQGSLGGAGTLGAGSNANSALVGSTGGGGGGGISAADVIGSGGNSGGDPTTSGALTYAGQAGNGLSPTTRVAGDPRCGAGGSGGGSSTTANAGTGGAGQFPGGGGGGGGASLDAIGNSGAGGNGGGGQVIVTTFF